MSTHPRRKRAAVAPAQHEHDAPTEAGRSPLRLLLAWFIVPVVLLVLSLALDR